MDTQCQQCGAPVRLEIEIISDEIAAGQTSTHTRRVCSDLRCETNVDPTIGVSP